MLSRSMPYSPIFPPLPTVPNARKWKTQRCPPLPFVRFDTLLLLHLRRRRTPGMFLPDDYQVDLVVHRRGLKLFARRRPEESGNTAPDLAAQSFPTPVWSCRKCHIESCSQLFLA